MEDVSLTATTHPSIHALACRALQQAAEAYAEMSIAVGEPELYLSRGTDLVLQDDGPGFVLGGALEMQGEVSGQAVLLFRPAAARQLLEVVTEPWAPVAGGREDNVRLGPEQVSVLLEVVTITLSAICRAIAHYLGRQTSLGDPQVLVGQGKSVVQTVFGPVEAASGLHLVAVVPFVVALQELEASLLIALDDGSLERLLAGMGAA